MCIEIRIRYLQLTLILQFETQEWSLRLDNGEILDLLATGEADPSAGVSSGAS